MKPKICQICGAEYIPTSNHQKYCSTCRIERHRERCRKYHQTHAERERERCRKYHITHLEQEKNRVKKYYQTHLERAKEYCQAHLEQRKIASRKYYQVHLEQERERCKEKSKEYRQTHPEQVREYSREYLRKYFQVHPEQAREYHRKWYHAHIEQRREYARKWCQAHPEGSYARNARRRGLLEKAEKVSPQEIFQRDGWICQICGKKVNPKLKSPDPISASLDHIIPLSKGGTHERKNLQLAHLICNIKKNNGGHDQLRLIG